MNTKINRNTNTKMNAFSIVPRQHKKDMKKRRERSIRKKNKNIPKPSQVFLQNETHERKEKRMKKMKLVVTVREKKRRFWGKQKCVFFGRKKEKKI